MSPVSGSTGWNLSLVVTAAVLLGGLAYTSSCWDETGKMLKIADHVDNSYFQVLLCSAAAVEAV